MNRILFVINNIQFLHSHRREIVQEAIRQGYSVHIAGPQGDGDPAVEDFKKAGAEIHQLPMVRSRFNPFFEIYTLFFIFKIFWQVRPDLIHSVTIKPNLYCGLINRLFRYRIVFAISGLGTVFIDQGIGPTLRRWILIPLFKVSFRQKRGRAIFQNDDDVEMMKKYSVLEENQIVKIKGSGVDTSLFLAGTKPPGAPRVAFSARLLKQKGILDFFSAVSILKDIHAKFVIIGGPDPGNPSSMTEDEVQKRCRELGMEYWGFRQDMHRALNEIHVFCLPSFREGLPKSLIEAAACGLPMITTDVPGCRDVVTHMEQGLLVPPKDPIALSKAIRTLVADADLRTRMGHSARNKAVKEFRLEHVIKLTLDLYKEMLAQ